MTDWNHLKNLSKMQTFDDVQEFENQIWELAGTKDPEILSKLIDLFDDECAFPEIMYGLIHAIETYPRDVYVESLIKKINSLNVSKYPNWLDRICNRIFNASDYLSLFRKHMHLADREALLKLFDIMEEESPHHAELIQELRKELV